LAEAPNEFEKTEPPTPRRKQEAREKGNVTRSPDLTAAFSLLAAIVLLYALGLRLLTGMETAMRAMLSGSLAANIAHADDLGPTIAFLARIAATTALPLLLAIALVSAIATVSQVGFLLTGTPIKPDINRLSPLKGAKRLVDARAAMRGGMSIAKVAIIGGVGAWIILDDMPRIVILAGLPLVESFAAICTLTFYLGLKLAALLMVLGILDYSFQRWQREQDLKMSKQEVKEELKRMDGDPQIKQRRGKVARSLAMQRMAQAVPNADVVVTNPTHFAIALRYDSEAMTAPTVIAKGADLMAMRIRQIATAHGVPLVERREVARGLYHAVEVGQMIPPDYYQAVAEILAYVFRLNTAAGEARQPQPAAT